MNRATSRKFGKRVAKAEKIVSQYAFLLKQGRNISLKILLQHYPESLIFMGFDTSVVFILHREMGVGVIASDYKNYKKGDIVRIRNIPGTASLSLVSVLKSRESYLQ